MVKKRLAGPAEPAYPAPVEAKTKTPDVVGAQFSMREAYKNSNLVCQEEIKKKPGWR